MELFKCDVFDAVNLFCKSKQSHSALLKHQFSLCNIQTERCGWIDLLHKQDDLFFPHGGKVVPSVPQRTGAERLCGNDSTAAWHKYTGITLRQISIPLLFVYLLVSDPLPMLVVECGPQSVGGYIVLALLPFLPDSDSVPVPSATLRPHDLTSYILSFIPSFLPSYRCWLLRLGSSLYDDSLLPSACGKRAPT